MAWKKHTKKAPAIHEANTKLDMEVRERLENMVKDLADSDNAVSLEFLKEFLHLHKTDDDAIQELRHKVDLLGEVEYRVIVDDQDQSPYIQFSKKSE